MTVDATTTPCEPDPPPPENADEKDAGEPSIHQNTHSEHVDSQVNNGNVHNQHIYVNGAAKSRKPLQNLLEDLLRLPRASHQYRHPLHDDIAADLDMYRVIALTSYKKEAAFAAAHALANDPRFSNCRRRVFFAGQQRDHDRDDLALMSFTDGTILTEAQMIVVEIVEKCTLWDSVLKDAYVAIGQIRTKLEQAGSYIILTIDDALIEQDESAECLDAFVPRAVSHLQYLFTRHFPDRAGELEKRLLAAAGPLATAAERREHYLRVRSLLARDPLDFLKYLAELEVTARLDPELRAAQLRTLAREAVFREASEVHKAAAFVGALLPELNQNDFDHFVRLILHGEMTFKEEVRHAFRRDGKLVTVRDKKDERCTDLWSREADLVFSDCHLRTVTSADGSWVVDFSEPHLGADLRAYLNERHPWYLRKQCERLQHCGILFDEDLSPKAVEGLVRLFVDRAIADPSGFGSGWLLELVRGAHRKSGHETGAAATLLEWLSQKLQDESTRRFMNDRLSTLIREMADHESLHPVIREFFERLLGAKQHDSLLHLILDVAPRLRYIPYFDPFIWMRRLLNEGSSAVRDRTRDRLIELARRAGTRIYEFLAIIHSWMPSEERLPKDYSPSEVLALEFLFRYCVEMSEWVTAGAWPSEHPLFYALPEQPDKARSHITTLIEWLLHARGDARSEADPSDPLMNGEVLRFSYVADLVEHWAWVLEGGPFETPAPQGQALLTLLLRELEAQLQPRERTWLQRAWQRRQEALLGEAATKSGTDRQILVAQKTKLEQLRVRFATQAVTQKLQIQGEAKS